MSEQKRVQLQIDLKKAQKRSREAKERALALLKIERKIKESKKDVVPKVEPVSEKEAPILKKIVRKRKKKG